MAHTDNYQRLRSMTALPQTGGCSGDTPLDQAVGTVHQDKVRGFVRALGVQAAQELFAAQMAKACVDIDQPDMATVCTDTGPVL